MYIVTDVSDSQYRHETFFPYRDKGDGNGIRPMDNLLRRAFYAAGLQDYKMLRNQRGAALLFANENDQKKFYLGFDQVADEQTLDMICGQESRIKIRKVMDCSRSKNLHHL